MIHATFSKCVSDTSNVTRSPSFVLFSRVSKYLHTFTIDLWAALLVFFYFIKYKKTHLHKYHLNLHFWNMKPYSWIFLYFLKVFVHIHSAFVQKILNICIFTVINYSFFKTYEYNSQILRLFWLFSPYLTTVQNRYSVQISSNPCSKRGRVLCH